MIDERHQRLSALVDGEGGPDELRNAVLEAIRDPELLGCWDRYLTIGRVLRGEPVSAAARTVAPRVAAAIEREPALPIPLPARRRATPRSAAPVIGLALAAGVALVAVVPHRLGEVTGEPPPVPRIAAASTQTGAVPGAGLLPAAVTERWTVAEPVVASKLSELLVSHRERAAASGFAGFIPYAAVVGYAGR